MTNIEKVQRDLELLKETGELKPAEYTEKTSHKYFSVFNLLKPYLFGGDTK